jgi:hypothetical protein
MLPWDKNLRSSFNPIGHVEKIPSESSIHDRAALATFDCKTMRRHAIMQFAYSR